MVDQNPFAYVREVVAGVGQREFGRNYGLARQTLVEIETGQLTEIPDKATEALAKAVAGRDVADMLMVKYGVTSLHNAYYLWQHQVRKENKHLLLPPSGQSTKELSPFHFLIKDTTGSLQGFAKKFCLPSSTLARYASGISTTIPAVIEEVLKECDYAYLPNLISAQQAWRTDVK